MSTKKEIKNLGTYEIDPKDPKSKQKLEKYLTAIYNGDYTYNPFRKVK